MAAAVGAFFSVGFGEGRCLSGAHLTAPIAPHTHHHATDPRRRLRPPTLARLAPYAHGYSFCHAPAGLGAQRPCSTNAPPIAMSTAPSHQHRDASPDHHIRTDHQPQRGATESVAEVGAFFSVEIGRAHV